MKFAISYFYQIRHFKPWMIPISTAASDPIWFHPKGKKKGTYIDKRGVINGLRCDDFAPGELCKGLCHGANNCNPPHPSSCQFLQVYQAQLAQISFPTFINRCTKCVEWAKNEIHFEEEPIIVMMVYEPPYQPCSERTKIQNWFASYGLKCDELILTN